MGSSLQAIQGQLTVGSLSAYIDQVNKIPMLTLEEEQLLANRLRSGNDIEAAKRLVMSHLRLVVSIARGYGGYGLSMEDLIQEGNIGLMKAVKRFDPTVGVRLVSFAIHWVRSEIHEFVLRNWRIVKIATTKAQRKLFFNIRKFAKQKNWFSEEETKTVADMLNVSTQEVSKMEQRIGCVDESFHAQDDEEESWRSPENYLTNLQAGPAEQFAVQTEDSSRLFGLQTALATLDPRERDILSRRWLKEEAKSTLQELAAEYGVSAERVRQLEKQAMQRLKHRILEQQAA
jgi:RNA polymerase sigma-32 factor